MITLVPATLWGFADRGLVRRGWWPTSTCSTPPRSAPQMPEVVNDLPGRGDSARPALAAGSSPRSSVASRTFEDGEHTGALAGELLRRGRRRRLDADPG